MLCADICELLLFQRSEIEHCSVQISTDCYCFSRPKSSVTLCRCMCLRTAIVSAVRTRVAFCRCLRTAIVSAVESVTLCRCLRTAIVSAVRCRALLCADVCGLLLFQRSELERCSVQMSADCYCFSNPNSSVALCRCLRTAIVSAVRGRALLCADVCGLLLFQQSEVQRCSVQMCADCYCFSGPTSSVALCRCLRTAIVSAVRSRASLCADVCGLLLFQLSEVERCAVQMSADCYCFSGPKSSVALFQRSEVASCSVHMSADCYCFSGPKSSVALC